MPWFVTVNVPAVWQLAVELPPEPNESATASCVLIASVGFSECYPHVL